MALPALAAIIPMILTIGRWVISIGSKFRYIVPVLLSFSRVITKIFTNGNVYFLWMASGVVMLISELITGNTGRLGGMVNNIIFNFINKLSSAIIGVDIESAFLEISPNILELMGYLGAIEAINVVSIGFYSVVIARLTWLIRVQIIKIALRKF